MFHINKNYISYQQVFTKQVIIYTYLSTEVLNSNTAIFLTLEVFLVYNV